MITWIIGGIFTVLILLLIIVNNKRIKLKYKNIDLGNEINAMEEKLSKANSAIAAMAKQNKKLFRINGKLKKENDELKASNHKLGHKI